MLTHEIHLVTIQVPRRFNRIWGMFLRKAVPSCRISTWFVCMQLIPDVNDFQDALRARGPVWAHVKLQYWSMRFHSLETNLIHLFNKSSIHSPRFLFLRNHLLASRRVVVQNVGEVIKTMLLSVSSQFNQISELTLLQLQAFPSSPTFAFDTHPISWHVVWVRCF